MLKDAHMALEAMSGACEAVKMEQWETAQSRLQELQQLVDALRKEIGDKQRQAMLLPQADQRDRD